MKRLLSITLATLILLALIPSIAITSYADNEQNYGKLGDINSDGDIDQYDYILAKRIHFNTYTPSTAEKVRGDVNGDGANDQYDYILIKRHHFKTYTIGSEPQKPLWTRDDAYYFGGYASDALKSMTSAINYTTAAMKNGVYMTSSYFNAIQSSVKTARLNLEKLKSYADTRAELEFVEGSEYATLSEIIDDTITMCLEFEAQDYYSKMLSAAPTTDIIPISNNLRTINQVAIELMEAFL